MCKPVCSPYKQSKIHIPPRGILPRGVFVKIDCERATFKMFLRTFKKRLFKSDFSCYNGYGTLVKEH